MRAICLAFVLLQPLSSQAAPPSSGIVYSLPIGPRTATQQAEEARRRGLQTAPHPSTLPMTMLAPALASPDFPQSWVFGRDLVASADGLTMFVTSLSTDSVMRIYPFTRPTISSAWSAAASISLTDPLPLRGWSAYDRPLVVSS